MVGTISTGKIYQKLLSFFSAAAYPTITYDPETRGRIVGPNAQPASIELNELSSNFAVARNRRQDLLDHTGWQWSVLVTFNQEVDFSLVRDALLEVMHVGESTRIALQRIRYVHPPRQEPNTGSRAEFVLNVLVHPL